MPFSGQPANQSPVEIRNASITRTVTIPIRLMYTVTHPVTGWWVALDTPESIAAIRAELGDRLVLGGVTGIDLSLLHGRDRLNTIENPCAPTPAPGSPRETPTC